MQRGFSIVRDNKRREDVKTKVEDSDVMVVFPSGGNPTAGFTYSLGQLMSLHPKMKLTYNQSCRLVHNRNSLVREFLRTDRNWLLTIDDDMIIPSDTLDKLFAVADPRKCPVIGGLAFGMEGGELFSTIMVKKNGVYHKAATWPPNALQECDATGAAFLLIHRSVLEKMDFAFEERTPHQWFEETVENGLATGEDTTFCERVKSLGFPIHVHTGLKLGHEKTAVLSEWLYEVNLEDKALITGAFPTPVEDMAKILNALRIPCGQNVSAEDMKRWRTVARSFVTPQLATPFRHIFLTTIHPALIEWGDQERVDSWVEYYNAWLQFGAYVIRAEEYTPAEFLGGLLHLRISRREEDVRLLFDELWPLYGSPDWDVVPKKFQPKLKKLAKDLGYKE